MRTLVMQYQFVFLFTQVYGIQSILLLNNMEKAGFIKIQGQYPKIYSTLRKTLNLLVEDINEQVSDMLNLLTTLLRITVHLPLQLP